MDTQDTQAEDLSQLVRLLKAVADESRLRILGIVANSEMSGARWPNGWG